MRRILIAFLGVAAGVLSFDSLNSHALSSGMIPEHAIIPDWLLAGLWAFVIDGLAVAGIWGIKANRGDRVAWSTFMLAAAASLYFQAATSQVAVLEKSVAPVALGLAIVVLKIGSRSETLREEGEAVREEGEVLREEANTASETLREEAKPPAKSSEVLREEGEVVRELFAEDLGLTADRIVEATGVGKRRAQQLLAEAKREGNGHRP
jgi:hypothetical protein